MLFFTDNSSLTYFYSTTQVCSHAELSLRVLQKLRDHELSWVYASPSLHPPSYFTSLCRYGRVRSDLQYQFVTSQASPSCQCIRRSHVCASVLQTPSLTADTTAAHHTPAPIPIKTSALVVTLSLLQRLHLGHDRINRHHQFHCPVILTDGIRCSQKPYGLQRW